MYITQLKKSICTSLFLLLFFFTALLPMSGLTQEEQMAFDMINNMTDAQKEEFMAEMQRAYDALSPEEQEKLLLDIQKEEERLKPALEEYSRSQQPMEVQPEIAPEIQRPSAPVSVQEEKPAISPSKKLEIDAKIVTAEDIIAQLLNAINVLLTTAQTIPNFVQTVHTWGERQEISDWTTDYTWQILVNQFEELIRKLHVLKDRDVESKEYKYLTHLIEDKSLYNTLQKLNTKLKNHADNIEGLSIETSTLSKTSENAIKKTIAILLEAIYTNTLTEDIDTLLSKYMSTADKIKAEREAMRKKAVTDVAKPAKKKAMRIAGSTEEPTYQPLQTPPAQSSNYSSDIDSLLSSLYGPDMGGGFIPTPESTSSQPISGGNISSPKSNTEKSKEEKKPETDKTADKHFAAFESALNAAMVSVDDGHLKEMTTLLQKTQDLDEETLKELMPDVVKELRTAIKEIMALRRHIKKLSPEIRKQYTSSYKKTMQEYNSLLSSLINENKKVQAINDATLKSEDKQKAKKLFGNITTQIERLLKLDISSQ